MANFNWTFVDTEGIIAVNSISASSFISASTFHGDGSGLTGVTGEWDGSLNGDAVITGSLNVTVDITGSTLKTATTVIDSTHVSSSLNISGSAFYGDGSNLTGISSSPITTYNTTGDNRIVTSVDSSTVQGEANLTFDGSKLSAVGQISASLGVTGSSIETANTVINSTHISSSLNVSGAAFYGDGSNLSGIAASPITSYNTTGNNRIITSVNASTVQGEANLTFDGSKLASVGQISASLGVTGSSLETATTVINSTHVSSSLNISGAAFYGDGANITNLPAPPVATYNTSGNNRVITSVNSSTIAGEANLTFDGSKLSAVGQISASLGVTGSSLETATTVINSTHISSSLNISGANFFGNGAQLTGMSPITNYNTVGDNRVLTSVNSSTIAGEANLTFDGTKLSAVGQISASLGVTGSSIETLTTVINSTHISSSLNISGAAFYGDGANITNLPAPPVATYSTSGNNRVLTSVDASSIAGEANLTFDGSKLSAVGQISASLGVTGSSLETATSVINTTHISSSLNISGAAFYGDGSNLTNLPGAAISTYNTSGDNRIITSVNSSTVQGEANLTFDGSKLASIGQISASLGITGSSLHTLATVINGTHISSSLNISGAAFYGDGANLTNLPAAAISTYNTSGDNRIITSVDSNTVQGEANLTFDGSKLSTVGQISASLGVTGSSLHTLATVINSTHISSSLNISGAAFYGNGANITNLPAPPVATYNTSGNNRVITSVDSSTIAGEANLTFDGNKLSAVGQISASLGVTGSSLNTLETVINSTHISSSLNISGAAFYGNGANITNLPAPPVATYNTSGDNRIITSVDSSTIAGEANLTFDGSKLAAVGQISASLGVTGSSLHTLATVIDGTHISSSLNISGAAFYGDGSNLTGISGGGSTNPGGSDTQVQYNNGGSFGGVASLTFNDSSGDLNIIDDKKLFFGTNSDASIEYDENGSNKLIISGAHGGIHVSGSGGLTVAVNDGMTVTSATDDNPTITIENTSDGIGGGALNFTRTTTDEAANDIIGSVNFKAKDAAGNEHIYAAIQGLIDDPTSGGEEGRLIFKVAEFDGNQQEGLRIEGQASDGIVDVRVSNGSLQLKDLGGAGTTPASGFGGLYVNGDNIFFITDGGASSQLNAAASSTAYNSFTANFSVTSDHGVIGIVTTGAAITASLAAANNYTPGQQFIFKDVSGSCSGSNHIVISASQNHAGDTIDGEGIVKIQKAFGSIILTTDGVKSFYIAGAN